MIEFYGPLSDKCKKDHAERRAKHDGFIFLIVTILVGAIVIIVGIFRNTWIYSLILTTLFAAITIVSFIPSKRFLSYKIPSRLIIENDMMSYAAIGGKNSLVTKPISRVKKIMDMGEWYYIIFKFGDISNSWVCQKDLIINGTIEDFEKMFNGKIERKNT